MLVGGRLGCRAAGEKQGLLCAPFPCRQVGWGFIQVILQPLVGGWWCIVGSGVLFIYFSSFFTFVSLSFPFSLGPWLVLFPSWASAISAVVAWVAAVEAFVVTAVADACNCMFFQALLVMVF